MSLLVGENNVRHCPTVMLLSDTMCGPFSSNNSGSNSGDTKPHHSGAGNLRVNSAYLVYV